MLKIVQESYLLRLALFFGLYILIQLLMLTQKPFINPRLMYGLYSSAVVFFSIELLLFKTNSHKSLLSYSVQLLFLFVFFYFANVWTSLFLFFILLFLFISGFQLTLQQSLILGCLASIFYSILNVVELKLTGLQNVLSLALFNSSFFTISFLSSYFSLDVQKLKKSLATAERKMISQAELAQTLLRHMPLQVFAYNSKNQMVFTNRVDENLIRLENFVKSVLDQERILQVSDVKYFDPEKKIEKYFNVDRASYHDADLEETIELILLRDQTERVKLIENLRQKEKLAAIGQLAAGIAHEIRNPLAGISGSVELLSKETHNEDDKKLMNIILKEINRLNNLITEFLEYARPEKKPDQVVDLSFLINETIENVKLSPWLPKNTKFEISLTSAARVLGESDKLKQAFLNIIVNGLQSMLQVPEPVLKVNCVEQGPQLIVKIKDIGSGMTDEVKKRIFEPFFTTKSKGTGLGMALTHKILEMHNVKVEIESQSKIGTTFYLTFNRLTS
jgi:two-component system, NtrC family, sensor histidine kinase PilS